MCFYLNFHNSVPKDISCIQNLNHRVEITGTPKIGKTNMHHPQTIFLGSINKFIHNWKDESFEKLATLLICVVGFVELVNDFHEYFPVLCCFALHIVFNQLRLLVLNKQILVDFKLLYFLLNSVSKKPKANNFLLIN